MDEVKNIAYSKSNTINGWFTHYGLFEMTLPICYYENDKPDGSLCIEAYSSDSRFGHLKSTLPFINESNGTGRGIKIDLNKDGWFKRVRLIIPVLHNQEIDEYCLMNRERFLGENGLEGGVLVYVIEKEVFFQLDPVDGFDGEIDFEPHPVKLNHLTNYDIKCLGEYDWTKE